MTPARAQWSNGGQWAAFGRVQSPRTRCHGRARGAGVSFKFPCDCQWEGPGPFRLRLNFAVGVAARRLPAERSHWPSGLGAAAPCHGGTDRPGPVTDPSPVTVTVTVIMIIGYHDSESGCRDSDSSGPTRSLTTDSESESRSLADPNLARTRMIQPEDRRRSESLPGSG